MVDLEERVRGILRDVAHVVRDFEPMQQRVREMIELARAAEVRYPAELVGEVERFLDWLLQLNFVLLGFREYELLDTPEGSRDVHAVPGSGLGMPLRRRAVDVLRCDPPVVAHPRRPESGSRTTSS